MCLRDIIVNAQILGYTNLQVYKFISTTHDTRYISVLYSLHWNTICKSIGVA